MNPYVPNTNTEAFANSYTEYATLHVPAASVKDYKAVEPWKNFKDIVGLDGTEVDYPKCATPTIAYANQKLTFSCDTEGVEFTSSITDSDIGNYYSPTIDLSLV